MADLYVDGRPACRLPCQTLVPAGLHRFEGRGIEGSAAAQNVYTAAGATLPLFFDVLPARATLRITTLDPNTLIYVDGSYVGRGGWQGAVPAGRHILFMRRSTGEVLQQTIDAAGGMNYTLRDNPPSKPPTVPPQASPVSPAAAPQTRPSPVNGAPAISTPGGIAPTYPQSPAPFGTQQPVPPSQSPELHSDGVDPTYRGITGAVFAPILLGGPSTSTYRDHCPAVEFSGSCTTGGPRGGAIALQLGYSLGWIAPEAMFALSIDVSSAGLHLPDGVQKYIGDESGLLTQVVSNTKFMRLGILGAVGARVNTMTQGRRFTLSGVFGYVRRNVYIIPDSLFGSKPSYSAPTLFFDSGIVFGDTPGVKVYAGLFLWLEFGGALTIDRDVTKIGLEPKNVPDSLERITPFNGTQVMFGPLVGVTFGH